MRVLAFALLLGSATAFLAPMKMPARAGTRAALRMSAEDMLGIDVETGKIFDPLGFASKATDEGLYNYRSVELKHGRVAMLAALGVIVQSFVQLPDPVFQNARPQAAFNQLLEQRPEALLQIVAAASLIEITVGRQDTSKPAGDLEFGKGFAPEDPAEFEALQLKELKNGRLAMVGITGMLVQEALTGQGPIEQLLAGHISPFGDGQGAF